MRYVHEAIAETRVQMRNAAMTMKRLKYKLFFKMRNILPTPCTMMVVGHFPCLERLFVCVYAMTQDIASVSDFGKYSELMHGPSLWSGQCQVYVLPGQRNLCLQCIPTVGVPSVELPRTAWSDQHMRPDNPCKGSCK